MLFGAISLDLFAVLLGGAVALLPIFAKDILEVGPTGLGLLGRRARRRVRRSPRRRPSPDPPPGGPVLFIVVAGFGASMVVFGLSREMWLSMLALALAGGFDLVSMVLALDDPAARHPGRAARARERGRDGLHQRVERARAFESGVAAALIGAVPAVVLGGIATIVVAGVWWRLFPSLARVDRLDELRPAVSVAPG